MKHYTTDELYALMEKRICPVCNRKIDEHTKNAKYVCLRLCQDRYGVAKKIVEIDGKKTEIRLLPKSLADEK